MKRFAFLIPAFVLAWEIGGILRAPEIIKFAVPLWQQTGAVYLSQILGFRPWVAAVSLLIALVAFVVPMAAVIWGFRLVLRHRAAKPSVD